MSIVYIRFSAHGLKVPRRSPLLERLLVRATRPVRTIDWRSEAFRAIASGLAAPSIAGAALAATGAAPGQWGCIASPVHCVAGMRAVTLPRNGRLTLAADEAGAMAADFNRTFAGSGTQLIPGRAGALICTRAQALDVATHDPEVVAGGDVFGFQPAGRDGAQMRRLMSEMEMWLFEHEINRARAAAGLLPVTGLWLWGQGVVPPSRPAFPGWTAGRDSLFATFGDTPEFPSAAGSGVLALDDVPGSDTWPEIERRWLAPAAAALAAGSLQRLVLCAAGRCLSVRGRLDWRLWRRRRPWWEYFDE